MTVFEDRKNLRADSSSLGTRMKRYRTELGFSIPKLARTLKEEYGDLAISENVLTNIELGRKTDISMEQIIEISHGLHITPLALICDLEQPFLISENPVFGARSKHSICKLFLSDMTYAESRNENKPMKRIRQILSENHNYWSEVDSYLDNYSYTEKLVKNKGKVDDDSALNATMTLYYAESSLEKITSIRSRLESMSVIIPQQEIERQKTEQGKLSRLKKLAIKMGITSQSEFTSLYEAIHGFEGDDSDVPDGYIAESGGSFF